MRYKAEVVINSEIRKEYYFDSFSHPRQVVRKVVEKLKRYYQHFIIFIANEYGEAWMFVAVRNDEKPSGMEVRVLKKYGPIFNKDDVELIFMGNKIIWGSVQ